MVKIKAWVLIGTSILVFQFESNSQTIIYTNLPSGVLTLSSDISVTNSQAYSSSGYGISFWSGYSEPGVLTGEGNFSVYNESTDSQTGIINLFGIGGHSVTTNYTGSITVVNDGNRFSIEKEDGSSYANFYAYGFSSDIYGNLVGDMTVESVAGFSSLNTSSARSEAEAKSYGTQGSLMGDIVGNVNVSAEAGTALAISTNPTVNAYADAVASAEAYAFYEVHGDLVGDTSVSSIGGNATAFSYDSGIGAAAESSAYGIYYSFKGDVFGDISIFSQAGRVTS